MQLLIYQIGVQYTINFALADWPDRDHVAKITVQLFGNDTAKTVTFTVEGGGTIKYNADYPRVGGVATATVDSSVLILLLLTFGHIAKALQYMQSTEVNTLNA